MSLLKKKQIFCTRINGEISIKAHVGKMNNLLLNIKDKAIRLEKVINNINI